MPISYEEVVKSAKDKEMEAKFKNVRTAMKLSLSKYLQEANDGGFEKLIDSFSGLDKEKKHEGGKEKEKSFLDDLLEIGKLMDETFNKLGDAEEGVLAHKLAAVSAIYMDKVSQACYEAKLNNFPFHKEKFSMDISEEQEAKSVVPRTIFRSIKMFLDKYYYVFRQYSVNAKAKAVFVKLSDFRDRMLNFEYMLGKSVNKLKGDYIKEIAPFLKDTRMALLRLRKFFEAIESSTFGKLVKALQDAAMETGTRMYVKYNATVTVVAAEVRKGSVIPLQSILEKYDKFMFPIRQTVAEYDSVKKGKIKEPSKNFWDISGQITSFRSGMQEVIDEFSNGVTTSDEDFKFFIHTVQAVLIPYMNQTRGEVNDTFAVGVNNLDAFFWKVTIRAIENGQPDGEKMDEIIGIAVRVKKSDLDKKRKEMTAGEDGEISEGE